MGNALIIGIAGGTGSGKTTFAQGVARRLGDDALLIAHDNYYRAHDDMGFEERTHLNYDHPDAYETDLLVEHLALLKAGKPVPMPQYDFSVHNRKSETIAVSPHPVIIVEGILVLASERLRDSMDLKVYVDVDADVRILRRLARDVSERGRSVESVIDQYFSTVRPMHDEYVELTKRFADIIVPAMDANEVAQELVCAWVRQQAK